MVPLSTHSPVWFVVGTRGRFSTVTERVTPGRVVVRVGNPGSNPVLSGPDNLPTTTFRPQARITRHTRKVTHHPPR